MNMMSKCDKFHVDIPRCCKLKFIPASSIELSEMADFVYNFVQKTNAIAQLWWQI